LGKAQYGQNGRLMRWAFILQQYQFTVKAIIKGSENVGADFLSRHSVTPEVEPGVGWCVYLSCFV